MVRTGGGLYGEAWKLIVRAFPVLDMTLEIECSERQFELALKCIEEMQLGPKIIDFTVHNIETYLRKHVATYFWKNFTDTTDELKGFNLFKKAVDDLYTSLTLFRPTLERLEVLYGKCPEKRPIFGELDVMSGFRQIVRATILSQLPLDFQNIINHFYKISFNVFCHTDTDDQCELGEDMLHCNGCGYELENSCQCQYTVRSFHDVNKKLMDIQLLERLTGQVLTNLIQLRIESHVQESCKGTFDVSHIASLEKWLDTTVMSWLTRIYCAGFTKPPTDDPYITDAIDKFKQKLNYYLYETYTRIRIDQLFNIIIEYPDSQPAIEDIKVCLSKTELRGTLTRELQAALESRLLHPGVNTPDILTAYISAIRALRHLDPSGVLLVTVTQPIRNYLRTREDTVRSVVISLTEEGPGSDLAEELARFSSSTVTNSAGGENDVPWDEWCPDPVEADPNTSSKYRRSSDIISMLVSVYGSKELFVNEYRTLLADRLLAQGIVNPEKEIRYLELLKLRFGESQLHFCEVMLRDISDSKRINGLIESDPLYVSAPKKFFTNAMILSAQFWPPFKNETLELPPEIKEKLKLYTKAFEALKGNRTLNWQPHLGTVNLEIEIGDKTLDLNVSPMQATIIMHFQEKPEWCLDDLSQVMKVPATVLRRKMTYWQSLGLMSVTDSDKYILIEQDESNAKMQSTTPSKKSQEMIYGEEEESPMASAMDQREDELQVFWSYVVGMLTNLDSMPLERIHQMLRMFASQDSGTEFSLQKVRHFLDKKVRNHQLILQAGLYKLPKN